MPAFAVFALLQRSDMRLLFIEACSNVSQVYDQLDRTARNNHNKVIFLITVVVLEHVESITTLWETDVPMWVRI